MSVCKIVMLNINFVCRVVHALEIKATRNPGPRDVRNLVQFGKSLNRPTRLDLFYIGNKYGT